MSPCPVRGRWRWDRLALVMELQSSSFVCRKSGVPTYRAGKVAAYFLGCESCCVWPRLHACICIFSCRHSQERKRNTDALSESLRPWLGPSQDPVLAGPPALRGAGSSVSFSVWPSDFFFQDSPTPGLSHVITKPEPWPEKLNQRFPKWVKVYKHNPDNKAMQRYYKKTTDQYLSWILMRKPVRNTSKQNSTEY